MVSSDQSTPDHRLLTPGEVAAMFRVDPKTVARWADADMLPSIRTLGGHRRYDASAVAEKLRTLRPGHQIPTARSATEDSTATT